MCLPLVLLFTLLPLAELYVLLQVGSYLGVGMTILVVVGTGVVGAQFARIEGWRTWRQMQENIEQGIAPTGELIDGILILAAGLLLITPGIITDVVGFSLLFPPTRAAIKRYIKSKIDASAAASADSSTIEVDFTRWPK